MANEKVSSQQEFIKRFMYSLDNTTASGKEAINEAINYASGGYFSNLTSAINQMVADCKKYSGTSFLLNKCGINLSNTDTGAITGYDAGGSTIKTKESIVPESGSLDTSFKDSSFTTEGGLTFNITQSNLTSNQLHIWQALKTWWAEECLTLLKESYGYSFNDYDATVREISVEFTNVSNGGYLAYVRHPQDSDGKSTSLSLTINEAYFKSFANSDVNGKSSSNQGYLDRTLAHELTHAIMAAKVDNYSDLPLFITEGLADLTQGIDDLRGSALKTLSSNYTKLKEVLTSDSKINTSYVYAAGYMFLRYIAKQTVEYYYPGSTTTTDTSGEVTIKGSVLTMSKDYSSDKLDLSKYSSVKTVKATALKKEITIVGNTNANSIISGSGNDILSGGNGNDTLSGGSGNDSLSGDNGNDKLIGGNGNDTLIGGSGNDSLSGGSGNDSLSGGSGNDTLIGGNGNDIFIYTGGNDIITDYTTSDKISLGSAVSKATLSGSNVIFTTTAGSLTVKNGKGKKLNLIDSSGKQYTQMFDGKTLTLTNTDSSPVTVNSKVKVIDASSRTKAIKITGNSLANTISGGSSSDMLYGGSGNDSILGNAGTDKLYGGAGNDILYGGAGNDSICGDAGNDKLYGGAGNDTLWGGAGSDTLYGDDGNDTFIYKSGNGKDTIYDFENDDLLQITGVFSASYNSKKEEIYFNVGSTKNAITLKDFTATSFNINSTTYKISGSKLVKS